MYGHAFNPPLRSRAPDPGTASALAWLERASLPVSWLSDPHIVRAALDGLCTRLDGSPAAANTITRKRAVFHGALGYAVELGLLPANPIGLVRWRALRAAAAISPATVARPAQVRAILTRVSRIKPELAAFFGSLYYAALRPEEAVTLRRDNLILPAHGRGKIILTAAYLLARDRETLVPGPALRKVIWPGAGAPGTLLAAGEIVGTWHSQKNDTTLRVQVSPHGKLSARTVAIVEQEAQLLARLRGCRSAVGFG